MEFGSSARSRENGKPFLFYLILIIINPKNKQEILQEDALNEKSGKI
jgi:hypothetical protein